MIKEVLFTAWLVGSCNHEAPQPIPTSPNTTDQICDFIPAGAPRPDIFFPTTPAVQVKTLPQGQITAFENEKDAILKMAINRGVLDHDPGEVNIEQSFSEGK